MKQKLVSFPLFGQNVTIYTYGTLLVVAFLVATWWARRSAQRRLGVDPERTFNVAFALLFIGIAGARLVYAFSNYGEFTQTPLKLFKIWEGGLNGYGGVVGALLWLAWWLPRHPDLHGFAFLDVLARATCLAFAIGWFAPLLAGDDFGRDTKLPWGIPAAAYEDGTPASLWAVTHAPLARLHPTQVYEALYALLLFVGLGLYARRTDVSGRVAAAFLMAHSVGHAVIEMFRGDRARGMLVEDLLSWSQFLAIPVFFAGVALWLIRRPDGHPAAPA